MSNQLADTMTAIASGDYPRLAAHEAAKPAEPVAWLHPANASCVTTDPTAYARGIPLYASTVRRLLENKGESV